MTIWKKNVIVIEDEINSKKHVIVIKDEIDSKRKGIAL